jgi:phosphatidylethanolamine-binding protein (PEBP) family uncharacterized protein
MIGRIAAVALLAVAAPLSAALAQGGFTVDFTWEGTAKCFDTNSPPFTLGDVPARTKNLRFTMIDLDFTAFHHGGGSAAYGGGKDVPRGGVVGDYRGPCPPSSHHYQWTVEALDGSGGVLATAKAMKEFPPD